MKQCGFKIGESSACVFKHEEKNLKCSVHGDDFTTPSPQASLDWNRKEPEKHYGLKEAARIGSVPCDDKEARMLN